MSTLFSSSYICQTFIKLPSIVFTVVAAAWMGICLSLNVYACVAKKITKKLPTIIDAHKFEFSANHNRSPFDPPMGHQGTALQAVIETKHLLIRNLRGLSAAAFKRRDFKKQKNEFEGRNKINIRMVALIVTLN